MTDDIACESIDTDDNGECFFLHHANFLGTDELFDPPKFRRIAVKDINHYGDKVSKIYPVGPWVVLSPGFS